MADSIASVVISLFIVKAAYDVFKDSIDKLKQMGSKSAWLKIQEIDESACIHRLLALEGAIQGVKKTMLSDEVKADLKEFYQWHRK